MFFTANLILSAVFAKDGLLLFLLTQAFSNMQQNSTKFFYFIAAITARI